MDAPDPARTKTSARPSPSASTAPRTWTPAVGEAPDASKRTVSVVPSAYRTRRVPDAATVIASRRPSPSTSPSRAGRGGSLGGGPGGGDGCSEVGAAVAGAAVVGALVGGAGAASPTGAGSGAAGRSTALAISTAATATAAPPPRPRSLLRRRPGSSVLSGLSVLLLVMASPPMLVGRSAECRPVSMREGRRPGRLRCHPFGHTRCPVSGGGHGSGPRRRPPGPVPSSTAHQRCATSITSRDPVPGPASTKTRNGSRARTPSPTVVVASKLPA